MKIEPCGGVGHLVLHCAPRQLWPCSVLARTLQLAAVTQVFCAYTPDVVHWWCICMAGGVQTVTTAVQRVVCVGWSLCFQWIPNLVWYGACIAGLVLMHGSSM